MCLCCSQIAFVAWVIVLVLLLKGPAAVSKQNGTCRTTEKLTKQCEELCQLASFCQLFGRRGQGCNVLTQGLFLLRTALPDAPAFVL